MFLYRMTQLMHNDVIQHRGCKFHAAGMKLQHIIFRATGPAALELEQASAFGFQPCLTLPMANAGEQLILCLLPEEHFSGNPQALWKAGLLPATE